MLRLGLKCSYEPEQLNDRLKYNPDIIELHLYEDDLFGEKRQLLENTISMLKTKGIQVFLHHPTKYHGSYLDINHEQEEDYLYFHLSTRILADICKTYSIQCVIHPHYILTRTCEINKENTENVRNEINKILSYGRNIFLWENSINGVFTAQNPNWFEEVVKPLNLPLTYDISHAFISFKGNNDLLINQIKQLDTHIQYFHVVDSEGKRHDGLPLGAGRIDWKPIIPYLLTRPYIYEIVLKDRTNASEMVDSHEYLLSMIE
ncbi:sugar phosphate isomerase/epimerase family protein [Neobacillus dielmonensis]|uniref:sugar phosphate isomerase/epimerase family protein n=1 Tax=Neobacillus dielmonensis TaxID=1347369 RepID=UPI0006939D98|nr:TIM barrel protein [Neobacillus dielmonensis]